jgi:GNAT superfamily N-acetyltransferase
MVGVEVRQAHADDWEELRKLRLRALTDAPDAFSSTLEQEAAYPAEFWQRWAEGGPASADFIAREGGASIGMAAILAESSVPGRMQLVAMWVDPHYRRRGVALALIDQALRWARYRHAHEVIWWVADQNSAACRLYERIGFRPTGGRQPLASHPALTESMLRLPLEGSTDFRGPAP